MLNRFLSDDLLRVPHGAMLMLGLFVTSNGVYVGFNAPIGQFELPMGMDFYCFWSAGRMTLDGNIRDIFNHEAMAVFQKNYLGAQELSSIPWFYPPLLLLWISCAFALVPYKIAYLAYMAVSVIAYYFLARRLFLLVKPLYIVAFPAFWFNLISGQNGLLSAVILVSGLVALAKQPVRAGCILALLSFKPQYCLALPVFLLMERQFQTMLAGALTLALLVVVSVGLWGVEPWLRFVDGLGSAQHYNQLTGTVRFEYQAHLFGTLRANGVNQVLAMNLNYAFAALAGCAAIRIWMSDHEATVKYAVVILMTLLLSPHLTYYDFVVTGAVIAWLWPQARLRPALIILWFSPVMWPVLGKIGIPQLPLAAAMLLYQLNQAAPGHMLPKPSRA
jgi:Glycosyltransferase family 87